MLKANLGVGPWSVFYIGVSTRLPLTLGRAIQVGGLFMILLALLLKTYPGIGTILHMFFMGFFIDLINPLIPEIHFLANQVAVLACGTVIFSIGSALYINADHGVGPKDSMVLGICKKTGRSIRLIYNAMEIMALSVGYFLGGPVGIGTIAVALSVGPIIQFFLKFLPEKEVRKQSILRSIFH
ncbi:MAG: membrane protein [Theionarchaea archaeon]|nr:membrane protein [Theionarchaea archaeon]